MIRAIIELVITIIAVMAARAILTSFLRGLSKASSGGFQQPSQQNGPDPNRANPHASAPGSAAGELHKDPVCGTYVAESTRFRRQVGGQTFYYCSEGCREKHALVAH